MICKGFCKAGVLWKAVLAVLSCQNRFCQFLGRQKVVFKISIVNLHNHAERLFRLFPRSEERRVGKEC